MTTVVHAYGPYVDDQGDRTTVIVELSEDPQGRQRLSFVSETREKGKREPHTWGQHYGAAPLALVALWKRWHLNDMKSGCSHQEDRYRVRPQDRPTDRNGYVGESGDRMGRDDPIGCSECGYRYGSSWLYEALPANILDLVETASKEPANVTGH